MFQQIVKVLSTAAMSSDVTVGEHYLVKPETNGVVSLYLVNTGNSTVGTTVIKQYPWSAWEAFAEDTDWEETGSYLEYYYFDADVASGALSGKTAGKYVIQSESFGQLDAAHGFAYSPSEGAGTDPANAILLAGDPPTTVNLSGGLVTSGGTSGVPEQTNAEINSAVSGGSVVPYSVKIVNSYDSTASAGSEFSYSSLLDGSADLSVYSSNLVVDVTMHSNSGGGYSDATPNSGAVFAFDAGGGDKYGLTVTGNYLIVKEGTDDYCAYVVTGDGSGASPYAITTAKIDLTLSDTDVTESAHGLAGITGLTYVTSIVAETTGTGGGTYSGPASGAPTIDAPDLSGKSIYSIDASEVGTDGTDNGVTNDGLYVILDNTGGGGDVDAYRVEGNAQQGWTVVEVVGDAFAAATTAEVSTSKAGELETRIVELKSGAEYDVYNLTNTAHSVASDGKYVVIKTGGATAFTSWEAYAVTGTGVLSDPYVMGAEDTAFNVTEDNLGGSIGTVYQYAADDGSNLNDQTVALLADGSKFDAFEVTGGNGAPFALGDKVADDLFADATAVGNAITGGSKVVGYLEDADTDSYAGFIDDAKLFEIDRVEGERYGNIITYGVKLKDGMLGESVTFDSLTFNVKWEVNSGDPDYDFWGQFKPADHAPALDSSASGASTNPVTFFQDGDDGITFGMFADTGIKFDEDEYIATFMLDKVNTDTENTLFLNTAQYTLYDATDMDSIKSPETPQYGTQAVSGDQFDFGYAAHKVGLSLEMDNGGTQGDGQNLADVELLKTDVAVGEGLSLVPVGKNGNLIKYHVVMNVPIPIFIQHDNDNTVEIDPDYKIEISGASIFDDSVQWLTDLAEAGSQTAELVDGARLAGDSTVEADRDHYTGHDFIDTIAAALDPENRDADLADLATSSSLTLEAKDLSLPDVTYDTAEGRYVLAEFVAISGATTAITYDTSQGDTGGDGYGTASTHTITRIADADGANAGGTTYWENDVADGAEVTVLAESLYQNEQAYNDAIGAEDALGALKISRDTAASAEDNTYSQVEIIAADFNLDGKVSSADAYDILEFAVHGNQPGGPTARFVYIDDVAANTARPEDVHYDDVVDKFVGSAMTIDATAVLIGDVSSSYSGPPATTYTTIMDKNVSHLISLNDIGILNMNAVMADEYGDAAGAATGRDLVLIGDDGSYKITNYVSADDGAATPKMSGDIVAVEGKLPSLTFATAATVTYASGTDALDTSAIIAAAKSAIDSTNNAVRILADDDDGVDVYFLAIDMDDSDSFTVADDLLIEAGSLIHLVSNPLDPDTFTADDFLQIT